MLSAPTLPSNPETLPVHHLRFTHDTIRPLFTAGEHSGCSLYELVNDLLSNLDTTLASLPALEVLWHDESWRCLSNRRLWCLKACAGILGVVDLHVKVKILTGMPNYFNEKNTTCNHGLSVQVVGDEKDLRHKLKAKRRTCRHFFGRGDNKGISCAFSHDPGLENTAQETTTPRLNLESLLAQNQDEVKPETRSEVIPFEIEDRPFGGEKDKEASLSAAWTSPDRGLGQEESAACWWKAPLPEIPLRQNMQQNYKPRDCKRINAYNLQPATSRYTSPTRSRMQIQCSVAHVTDVTDVKREFQQSLEFISKQELINKQKSACTQSRH